MPTLFMVFAAPLQVFVTLLKITGKSVTIHFSEVNQKLVELQQNQTTHMSVPTDYGHPK